MHSGIISNQIAIRLPNAEHRSPVNPGGQTQQKSTDASHGASPIDISLYIQVAPFWHGQAGEELLSLSLVSLSEGMSHLSPSKPSRQTHSLPSPGFRGSQNPHTQSASSHVRQTRTTSSSTTNEVAKFRIFRDPHDCVAVGSVMLPSYRYACAHVPSRAINQRAPFWVTRALPECLKKSLAIPIGF